MLSGIVRPSRRSWFSNRTTLVLLSVVGVLLRDTAAGGDPSQASIPPATKRPVDFAKDIQPILADRCYSCHGADKQKAELRWDLKSGGAFKSGEHGPVIVPGNSASSRVIKLVSGLEPDAIMPPKGDRLSPEQIG